MNRTTPARVEIHYTHTSYTVTCTCTRYTEQNSIKRFDVISCILRHNENLYRFSQRQLKHICRLKKSTSNITRTTTAPSSIFHMDECCFISSYGYGICVLLYVAAIYECWGL